MAGPNYIRRMNFFQMIGALISIFWKSFVPLMVIGLINIIFSFLFFVFIKDANSTFGVVVFLFLPILYTGPILVAISNSVLGKKVMVLESYRSGLSAGLLIKTILAALPACVISTVYVLSVITGSSSDGQIVIFYLIFFLLLPVWIFFPMTSLLEKKAFFPAIGRSFKMFLANFGRSLLFTLTCSIFAIPFIIIGPILDPMLGNLVGQADSYPIDTGMVYAVPFVTMLAISLYIMAYYETRARRENYSADILSQELGFAPLDEMMGM